MRSVYTDYVCWYVLNDYSRDDSEFYALLETDDLWERPEPKKQCNNADKEVPEPAPFLAECGSVASCVDKSL